MLKILSIKYRKDKILYSEIPANMYISKEKLNSFILYHRRIASEMFGEKTSVILNHRERPDKEVSALLVFKLVAERLSLDPEGLIEKTRVREIVEARQMAIKICNEELDIVPSELERETNITHDNQWSARKTIQGLIDTYKRYEEKYNDVLDFVLDNIFNTENHEKPEFKQTRRASENPGSVTESHIKASR